MALNRYGAAALLCAFVAHASLADQRIVGASGATTPASTITDIACVDPTSGIPYSCAGSGGGSGGTSSNARATYTTTTTNGQTDVWNMGYSVSAGGWRPLLLDNNDYLQISAAAGAIPDLTSVAANTASQANAATASAAINVSTATTTQLVALSSGKAIYVSGYDVIPAAADSVTFEYGTGTNCGTGTTALTGAYPLAANGGLARGNGLGTLLFVPASNALCIVTSAAVQASGSVSYAQK